MVWTTASNSQRGKCLPIACEHVFHVRPCRRQAAIHDQLRRSRFAVVSLPLRSVVCRRAGQEPYCILDCRLRSSLRLESGSGTRKGTGRPPSFRPPYRSHSRLRRTQGHTAVRRCRRSHLHIGRVRCRESLQRIHLVRSCDHRRDSRSDRRNGAQWCRLGRQHIPHESHIDPQLPHIHSQQCNSLECSFDSPRCSRCIESHHVC